MLTELVELTRWDESRLCIQARRILSQRGLAQDTMQIMENEAFLVWLTELLRAFDSKSMRRLAFFFGLNIYCFAGCDLARADILLDTPSHGDPYPPRELMLLGCFNRAKNMVRAQVDTQVDQRERRMLLSNPYADPEEPRHLRGDTIETLLSGRRGDRLAKRMEAHLIRCPGCAKNVDSSSVE